MPHRGAGPRVRVSGRRRPGDREGRGARRSRPRRGGGRLGRPSSPGGRACVPRGEPPGGRARGRRCLRDHGARLDLGLGWGAAVLAAGGHRRAAVRGLAAAGVTWLAGQGLKRLFERPRPYQADADGTRLLIGPPSAASWPSSHPAVLLSFVEVVGRELGWRARHAPRSSARRAVGLRVIVGVHYRVTSPAACSSGGRSPRAWLGTAGRLRPCRSRRSAGRSWTGSTSSATSPSLRTGSGSRSAFCSGRGSGASRPEARRECRPHQHDAVLGARRRHRRRAALLGDRPLVGAGRAARRPARVGGRAHAARRHRRRGAGEHPEYPPLRLLVPPGPRRRRDGPRVRHAFGRIGDLTIGDHLGKPTSWLLAWQYKGARRPASTAPSTRAAPRCRGASISSSRRPTRRCPGAVARYSARAPGCTRRRCTTWSSRPCCSCPLRALAQVQAARGPHPTFGAWYGATRVIEDFLRGQADLRLTGQWTG